MYEDFEIDDLQYVLTFGKHKGETLENIIYVQDDAKYLLWAIDEGILDLSDRIRDIIFHCSHDDYY